MSKKKVPIQAVVTTFDIVEGLSDLGAVGVTELANHLDLPKSTVHVHLRTLVDCGYVIEEGDHYQLSLLFLNKGGLTRSRIQLYEQAKPVLEDLADETGELANLLVEENDTGIHLYKAKGADAVEIDTYPGKRIPLHQTSRGKAYLAHLPEPDLQTFLDSNDLTAATDRTITDRASLLEEMAEVRERGVAFDKSERISGLRCVAAPITNEEEYPVGAISVAGPSDRLTAERFDEHLPDKVRNAANVIKLNLTFS